jgi:hypothetical protein
MIGKFIVLPDDFSHDPYLDNAIKETIFQIDAAQKRADEETLVS